MFRNAKESFLSGFVTISGRTNVGKSTLFNRLVGEKLAIVTRVPQTTRQRIIGVRTGDNFQIAFVDAPGFHKPQHAMNRAMMEEAYESISNVDIIIFMIAADEPVGKGDIMLANILSGKDVPVICAINKVDLVKKALALPLIDKAVNEWGMKEAIPISALTGENCDRLFNVVVQYLPEGEMLFPKDYLTDRTERDIVGEMIREKVFLNTRQELPHSTAVIVDGFHERNDNLIVIEASIVVEKESQKGIVIGKGGQKLKSIGVAARAEIERFLSKRIYLELAVKVRKRWRDDDRILRKMGLKRS